MRIFRIDDNIHTVGDLSRDLTLWRGERAYVRFAVEGMPSVVFSATGIDAEFIFYKEGSVKAYLGNAGWYSTNMLCIMPRKSQRISVPDVLYPVEGAESAADLTVFWLEIKVADDAAAKSGKVTVTAACGGESLTIDIATTVLPLSVKTNGDYRFSVEYWHYPYRIAEYYGVEPFSAKHIEILKRTQGFYKEHAGEGVTATIVEEAWGGQTYAESSPRYPSMIKWILKKDGTWQFDYTDFDKWVKLNEEVGLADKFCCYSPMPWRNKIAYYDEQKARTVKIRVPATNAELFEQIWTPFFNDFIKHVDERDWFDRMYIAFDERDGVEAVLKFVKSFKNKDGKSFRLTAALSGAHLNHISYLPYFDYISAGTGLGRIDRKSFRTLADQRSAEGKKTTLYTSTGSFPSSFTLSEPVEGYCTMLYAASCRANGFLRWALDAWVKEPLKDTTHWAFQAGDCFLVYPAKDGGYLKSVRFLKLDEGMQDANKLAYLSENAPKLHDAVNALLDSVKFDYDYKLKFRLSMLFWGRPSFWMTEKGRTEMLADMSAGKAELDRLSLLAAK